MTANQRFWLTVSFIAVIQRYHSLKAEQAVLNCVPRELPEIEVLLAQLHQKMFTPELKLNYEDIEYSQSLPLWRVYKYTLTTPPTEQSWYPIA